MLTQARHHSSSPQSHDLSQTNSHRRLTGTQTTGESLELTTQPLLASFSRKLRKFRKLSPNELRELISSFLSQEISLGLYPLGGDSISTELRSVRRADPTIAERDITFDKLVSI
jgi:hypothetical protein